MGQQKPSGSGVSNPSGGSTANATGTQGDLYFFHPETASLLVCPAASVQPVAQEIALMSRLSEQLIEARQELGLAQADWLQRQSDVALRPQIEARLKAAINKEEAATAEVHEELKEIPAFNKDGVWELMPLRQGKGGKGDEQYFGRRLTYVRSDKIKNHFRKYRLASDKPELKSFLVKDPATKQWHLDHKNVDDKIKEAFHKATLHEWKSPPWGGGEWSPPGMISSFNQAAQFKSPDDPHAMSQFSASAQLFRFFAGAGGTAKVENSFKSFDDALHMRGEIAASMKAKGEIGVKVVEAKAEADFYLPWKAGIELWIPAPTEQANGAITWNATPDTTLGYFRLSLECKGAASGGASLLAEGGVEFKAGRDGKQTIKGSRAKLDPTQVQKPKMDVTKVEVKGDMGVDLKAFAGAEAEVSFEGALQWRRPQEKDTWKAFAALKPGISGQAGIGAQAAFHVTYDGKFRLFAKLGVCAGAGLKGEVEATVDVVYMAEFAWWAKTQIAYAGDKNLKYFEDSAFKTFIAMYTLAVAKGKEIGTYLGKEFEDLRRELDEFVVSSPRQFINAIRNAHDSLLNGLAEVKGYLIHALKMIGDQFDQWRIEAGEAIGHVLASAQISNELQNIYAFTSPEIAVKGSGAQVARAEISGMIGAQQVAAIESRVRSEPAPGFLFAFNDTPRYSMQAGTNMAWLDPTTTPGTGGNTMVA